MDAAVRGRNRFAYLHPDRRDSACSASRFVLRRRAANHLSPATPPLILVGDAGGKVLTLEKQARRGEVRSTSAHSAYLAQSARDLYYAHGFEHPGQDASFLSFREFVELIRVPSGREASWRDFAAWFARMRQGFRDVDAHQAFEEIRGVIAARADGVEPRRLPGAGRARSIFPGRCRERRSRDLNN